MQNSSISCIVRAFIQELQKVICELSKQDKEKEAKTIINHFAFNIIIRVYAIHIFTGRTSRFTPGIDKFTITGYEECLVLLEQSKFSNIKPKCNTVIKRVKIPKGYGKTRPLGIFNMLDRVLQKMLTVLIEPFYDAHFHSDVYGFRPGRSAIQAVARATGLLNQGQIRKTLISIDIEGCFDNIATERLLKI